MDDLSRAIQENLFSTQEKIIKAAQSSRRNPADINLVVVSKGQPVEVNQAAIQAGAHLFGENYPEQAQAKINALQNVQGIEWHMIGHLQSRKAKIVVEYFQMIHSLDRLDLAEKLENLLSLSSKILPVLLEVNVAGEESKSGWKANEESQWNQLLPDIERILTFPHLEVRGLMTMPPLLESPDQTRPYFVRLARLRNFLSRHFPLGNFKELSMGTSADYEVAIQEGATYVRIGSAILGPRPVKRV